MTKRSERSTHGLAGVFAVASELSCLGHGVALTLGNTKGVDLFVSKKDTHLTVPVQIKTKFPDKGKYDYYWRVTRKGGEERLVFVFVIMNNDNRADYYVVPGKTVVRNSYWGNDYPGFPYNHATDISPNKKSIEKRIVFLKKFKIEKSADWNRLLWN